MLTICCQIESKAYLIQSAALKIDKVSVAELPLVIKYQVYVMHWGYKDEASTIREIFLDKWTNGDAGRPAGTVRSSVRKQEGGSWVCGRTCAPDGGGCGRKRVTCFIRGIPERHLHQGQNQRCAQVTVEPQQKQLIKHNTLNNVTWSSSW